MKTLITIVIAASLFIGSTLPKENTTTLTVTVDGIRNTDGWVGLALYDSEGEFLGEGSFAEKELEAGSTLEFVFEDIPNGTYAIAAIHDENGNGDLDTNEYGMPTEGFGFSNEAQATMGPPSFDEASFEVDGETEHYIEMVYMGGY